MTFRLFGMIYNHYAQLKNLSLRLFIRITNVKSLSDQSCNCKIRPDHLWSRYPAISWRCAGAGSWLLLSGMEYDIPTLPAYVMGSYNPE